MTKTAVFRLFGVVTVLATSTHAAAAADVPAWLTERRIIETNDLEPIEAARSTKAYDMARSVARVETIAEGRGFCTGSRVGGDLFLTNFHCFEYEDCDNLQFHLGYERGLDDTKQLLFKCKEVLAKSETLDYALYRVEFTGPSAEAGVKHTFSFDNLSIVIPDNDIVGTSKTFTIDQDGVLKNLGVRLSIEHAWIDDLTIELSGPNGVKVKLTTDVGTGTGLDYTYSVNEGLRALLGQAARGAWTVSFVDNSPQDVGTLKAVEFIMTTKVVSFINPGFMVPDPVDPGTHPSDYPIATLWAGEIIVDQPVFAAGYPGARAKEIDRSDSCKLRTIVAEEVDFRQTLTHLCDTEGSSSGTPLLDRTTGNIVALHWGGLNEFNFAIPMSLIVKDLEGALPAEVLQELHIAR